MSMVKAWLWDSVDLQWVKALCDSSGHVQVDVLSSALPTGAATSAKQDTMITALQLIDDLRNALGSVNTDDLQVDVKTLPNLLSNKISAPYFSSKTVTASAGTNGITDTAVSSGKILIVTNVHVINGTANRADRVLVRINSTYILQAWADHGSVNVGYTYPGWIVLKAGDYIDGAWFGCVAGDVLYLDTVGFTIDA